MFAACIVLCSQQDITFISVKAAVIIYPTAAVRGFTIITEICFIKRGSEAEFIMKSLDQH